MSKRKSSIFESEKSRVPKTIRPVLRVSLFRWSWSCGSRSGAAPANGLFENSHSARSDCDFQESVSRRRAKPRRDKQTPFSFPSPRPDFGSAPPKPYVRRSVHVWSANRQVDDQRLLRGIGFGSSRRSRRLCLLLNIYIKYIYMKRPRESSV